MTSTPHNPSPSPPPSPRQNDVTKIVGASSMDFLNGITLLLIYELVGEVSIRLLNIPIPGPVMGMLLLFITLLIRGRSLEALDSTGSTLLSHLSLLFVPAGVGIMVHFDRIVREWLPISLTLVLTTVITMAVTAVTMQLSTHFLSRRA